MGNLIQILIKIILQIAYILIQEIYRRLEQKQMNKAIIKAKKRILQQHNNIFIVNSKKPVNLILNGCANADDIECRQEYLHFRQIQCMHIADQLMRRYYTLAESFVRIPKLIDYYQTTVFRKEKLYVANLSVLNEFRYLLKRKKRHDKNYQQQVQQQNNLNKKEEENKLKQDNQHAKQFIQPSNKKGTLISTLNLENRQQSISYFLEQIDKSLSSQLNSLEFKHSMQIPSYSSSIHQIYDKIDIEDKDHQSMIQSIYVSESQIEVIAKQNVKSNRKQAIDFWESLNQQDLIVDFTNRKLPLSIKRLKKNERKPHLNTKQLNLNPIQQTKKQQNLIQKNQTNSSFMKYYYSRQVTRPTNLAQNFVCYLRQKNLIKING